MKKIFCIILIPVLVFASNSTFSRVRATKYDSDGTPSEEVNDIVICLERNPTDDEKKNYEDVIGYYADGLYEATNGANFIGNVVVYTNGRNCSSADITWKKNGIWPGAWSGGIKVSDIWRNSKTNVDTPMMDSEKKRFDFGITLVHETMHYRYGIDDDYSKTELRPFLFSYNIKIEADPENDMITVSNNGLKLGDFPMQFIDIVSPFSASVPIYFIVDIDKDGNIGTIPTGLPIGTVLNDRNPGEEKIQNGWLVKDYAVIDEVDVSRLNEGVYSFNLKDAHGNRIDIKDAGVGMWGFNRPDNVSVAHSLMNYQYYVATSRACDANNIQWQWANLGTSFNTNPASPMGVCCRDIDGNILSGWDAVTINPDYEVVHGQSQQGRDFRYWYKSLIKKKPTETDVFRAKSFYKNYDESSGKVLPGYAVWVRDDACGNESTYDLPFMKVELAGRSPAEYQNDTWKYLKIHWVDVPEVETIVLIDRSTSMSAVVLDQNGKYLKKNNGKTLLKMDQALQAAKYVSQGFLSSLPKSGSGNPGEQEYDVSNVSVGVYAFTDQFFEVYPPTFNPDVNNINASIDAVTLSGVGGTALFDAIISAMNKFSSNPTSTKMLYVISDGLDVSSSHTKADVVQLYKNNNIAIHTFAYGRDADLELLSSMASETNGVYYENEEELPLNVSGATSAILSSMPGNNQLMSANLSANATSADVYVPPRSKLVKILGSYRGSTESQPVEIISRTGVALPVLTTDNSIWEENDFVAEIDSTTLSQLSEPFIKVRNKLSKAPVDVRMIVTNEFDGHSINVKLSPTGPFEWPSRRSFTASVRGNDGLLADVVATGKLINPDGSVRSFALHDDGMNGDYLAGDGVYFADLPSISQNGTYQWEISMSNKGGIAHTTRIGSSLPDTIPFVEKTDASPFELFRNGQFVVFGCCSDEPTSDLVELYPEKRVNAYLQPSSDEDRFKIAGTLSGKSYALYLSSRNLDSFDDIKVYSPTDLATPVYAVNVEPKNGYDYISVPLSSEYASPGFVVAVNGSSSVGTNYDLILLERNYAEFAVGRFEQEADWHSEHTTVALDSKRKSEGVRSLVTPAGWKIIESRNISTSDFELVGKKMRMDVFVPVNTQNRYWIGNVELWLSVPSSNKRIQLGSQQQIQPYLGGWKSYEFDVNDEARQVLAEPHGDARFQIVLNTADSLWIDNLRFVGGLQDNPVNQWEPACPDDTGCNPTEPIQLRINESVRVVVDGDVYVEIVDFPTDWTPEKVKVGLSAEDGSPMTGTLSYDGGSYPLSDWYLEKLFNFTRGKRYLLKLHNVGSRLYRVSAWTEGLARDLASAGGILNSVWNVKF